MVDGAIPEGAEPMPAQPGLKFLEAAVYIMGGLLVLMFLGLMGGIAWKIAHRDEASPTQEKHIELNLPADANLNRMTLDGDHLAVEAGGEIIVINIRKGAVISRIRMR
jgi:hypothetical protein